ncbi:MAG TPA: molybdopterin-dependent oxidoreductase, partial [Ktedonobacteraceae bacterium]|nr:molybdopterin-dependent oxidoreductase [Ktedonobacteraceae bacterium]
MKEPLAHPLTGKDEENSQIKTRQVKTMCPMNCHPTQCGMTVQVQGNTLLGLKGDTDHPESRGFLCIRGQATREIFDNPKRLLTPLRRAGQRGEQKWEACTWDEALDMMSQAIEQTSPERVGIWRGHGIGGTGINSQLVSRFGTIGGFQVWSSAIVCWALGGYGLALTGLLEASTKEDMAAHSQTILMWGATLSSQPGIASHLIEARKRGAHIIQIDTRRTELSQQADEIFLLRPGTDAALALSLAHVLVEEGLVDQAFLDQHTLGFEAFAKHVQQFSPEWGAAITGLSAKDIRHIARHYATSKPAMIVLGGSSMFKHEHGWESSRAIACLPALTGQLGFPGAGLGPRHGATSHSDEYANVMADVQRPQGNYIPSHMSSINEALNNGQLDVLLLFGTNMLSSYADTNSLAQGLAKVKLIVAYDLFMNETIRQTVDLILPSAAWLEESGLKQTATHIYLMERALEPAGEARPLGMVLKQLAERLSLSNVFPWLNQEDYMNALLKDQHMPDNQSLTVADLRAMGGYWQRSNLSAVAYPDYRFHTPSQKVEFWSERALQAGLSPLPSYTEPTTRVSAATPLRLSQGRTLTAFHAFYDEGQALPTLAKANPAPELWIHPQDAHQRQISNGARIVMKNQRGQCEAVARVTDAVSPGVVWMRDGWSGINRLTNGAQSLPLLASEAIAGVPGGQAAYDAQI